MTKAQLLTFSQAVNYLREKELLDRSVPIPVMMNRARTWRKRGSFPKHDELQFGHPLWRKSTLLGWARAGKVPAGSKGG